MIAIRPGYWRPAHFASAASTLDQLTGGRVLVNIVSGQDNLAAYGDSEGDQPQRYARTKEFIQLVRRLWTEEDVTFEGEHFSVAGSTVATRPVVREGRLHPRLYFGGASDAAQRVAATEADVQLFWGEPLDGIAERIARCGDWRPSWGVSTRRSSSGCGSPRSSATPPTRPGRTRRPRSRRWPRRQGSRRIDQLAFKAVGQQRLLDLAERGEVLDDNLYTAPGKYGGGGAGTTWLVGSADDVAKSLRKYQDLGVTHFVLSDTPYREEIVRIGDQLLPLVR